MPNDETQNALPALETNKPGEATDKQEAEYKDIDASEKKEKEGIFYTKKKRVRFPVKVLSFTNIPVLTSVPLSFYEKYIVLILQKGLFAENNHDLSKKLSELLNVSEKCVTEFVEYLIRNSYLNYLSQEGKFVLDESIHFVLDKTMDDAMFAEFGVKKADCDKILFVDGLDSFYLEDDFNNDVFRKKGVADSNKNNALPASLLLLVEQSREKLEPLFVRAFANTNMHLKKNFTYQLEDDKSRDYQLEFDALISYEYIKSEKRSIQCGIKVLKGNFLPESFISSLLEPYNEDDSIPKFLEMDESFYQKITPNSQSIFETEKNIDATNKSIAPIAEELKEKQEKLTELKKEHKRQKQEEDVKTKVIRDEIASKDDEIKINEELIADNGANKELIRHLQKTIKQLKASKSTLEAKLGENEKTIEELTNSFKKSEEEFTVQIAEKEQQISTFNQSIQAYEKKQRELSKAYGELVTQNQKKLHPTIKDVIAKYPASQNILYRYVSDISMWLDKAVSASEFEAFDEIGRCIDTMREMYRKTLQAVFDVILGKNVKNLGMYLTDPFNLIAIDKAFQDRKIPLDIKNKLVIFHSLANAIGHSLENGPKKKENMQRIADFKQLDPTDREKILLAIPDFFNSIKFTKSEVTSIVEEMKV